MLYPDSESIHNIYCVKQMCINKNKSLTSFLYFELHHTAAASLQQL